MPRNYRVTQLDEVPPVPCPCGQARRAFASDSAGDGSDRADRAAASVHLVDISADARPHYHRRMTEIYLVLEGEGHLELDGDRVPVRPMTAVYIHPGCRHRAVGKLKIINIPVPAFDPTDEWFDE